MRCPRFKNTKTAMSLVMLSLLSAAPWSPLSAKSVVSRPYMGWSSWSLQATKHPGYNDGKEYWTWLTEAHVRQQVDIVHAKLQPFGYRYVNIDSGWHTGYDQNGRPVWDPGRFPHGISGMADYVHKRGLKLGIYTTPGIPEDLYKLNPTILGTRDHVSDIVVMPLHPANGWGGGYKIDYSKPGAQKYIDSIASLFTSWGIDFLKFDGVTPGSDHNDTQIDARPDVAAWRRALNKTGRPVWLELSWAVDGKFTDDWRKSADGWRLSDDVESYGNTLVDWESVSRRFKELRNPVELPSGKLAFGDVDSLDIGSGPLDGLTPDERQSVASLWAIQSVPWFTGDDLTKLDGVGLRLLTNPEVIAVDQAGSPSTIINSATQQIRCAYNIDGTITVALFNRAESPAVMDIKWNDLGVGTARTVRDLWARTNLTGCGDGFNGLIPAHGSKLLRIVPRVPVNPSYSYFVDTATGGYLSVSGGSTNDAAALQLTSSKDDSAQWLYLRNRADFGVLVNKKSGLIVNIPGPSKSEGAALIQYPDDGNSNSRWKLVKNSDGTVSFASVYDGLYITANATSVSQEAGGRSRQSWKMLPVK